MRERFILWHGIPCGIQKILWQDGRYVLTVRFDNDEEFTEWSGEFEVSADDYLEMEK